MWRKITEDSKIYFVFVKCGVKINQQYYQDKFLQKEFKLFPQKKWIRNYEKRVCTGASLFNNIEGRRSGTIYCIFPDEWPTNSPDISPMDISVWRILKVKVLANSHQKFEIFEGKIEIGMDQSYRLNTSGRSQ